MVGISSNSITLMLLHYYCAHIFLTLLFCPFQSAAALVLPHQHPHPDLVALQLHRLVNVSLSTRRQMLASGCLTGNPIDDCWKCDPHWASNRQRLADCGIGFGQGALGVKVDL